MEVVVTEEKKKIFRARKTMKISDRQQLETLHSTLFTAASSSSEPSPPPPLMNGSHREDGQKDMEQNSHQDSNSPIATSPASMTSLSSPAPFLSLNLSPSPVPSQSPKEKDEPFSGPSSPFQTIDFEHKKEEGNSLSLQETSEAAAAESKEPQDSTKVLEKPEEAQTPAEKTANESIKDSSKGSASLPPESDGTVPMETNATMADDAARIKSPSTNSSIPSASSSVDIKQDKDIKQETSKDQQKRNMLKQDKMEVTVVKVEAKKIKTESEQSLKPPRPSSTPPSGTASEKNCSSGIKRTLSEGFDKEGQTIKRDGKRPKMDQGELEAQLELKITAKAGSHHKLEKIVQQLVSERLKALEMAILEESFQDLKGRVDKIECATKHQMAIHSLQAKIARLSKKFGEANQASENKRKHEALVASSAIAAAAAAVASAAATTTTKTSVINTPQVQRVLRRQAVEPQPETPRQQVALSDGKTPGKKEKGKEDKGQAKEKEMPRKTTMAKDLAEYNEGKCKADIKLRPLPAHMEKVLYHNSKRNTDAHRPDRYASYIFRYLVPYEIYCNWVNKVDYVGLMGKQALPRNLRRTMRKYIEHRFPGLPNGCWREIRDLINEILQVKRRPEFFQKVDGKNGFLL